MTDIIATSDVTFNTVGAFADSELTLSLPSGQYQIEAQVEWSQAASTDGGIQVGLNSSVAPVAGGWSAAGDSVMNNFAGNVVTRINQAGNRIIDIAGFLQVGATTTLTLMRGLAQTSANLTTRKRGSFIRAHRFTGLVTTAVTTGTALLGWGSMFGTFNASTPDTLTVFGQVSAITGPHMSVDSIDLSHELPPGSAREAMPGMMDFGDVQITFNFVPNSLASQALMAEMSVRPTLGRRVVFPDGSFFNFNAFLTDFQPSEAVADRLSGTATFKVTGPATLMPAS